MGLDILEKEMVCKICGQELDQSQALRPLHLWNTHKMTYQDYYEFSLTGYSRPGCLNCGCPKNPVIPYMSSWYVPCWSCLEKRGDGETQEAEKILDSGLFEWTKEISRNKYYQMLLADTKLISLSLPKRFPEISDILENIRKRDKIKIAKDTILGVTWDSGYPKEISQENIEGTRLEILEPLGVNNDPDIGWTDVVLSGGRVFRLMWPEICEYDMKHHGRHSILNMDSKRNTKKLRMGGTGSTQCVKFWNTHWAHCKTIFRLLDRDTLEYYDPILLGHQDRYILKTAIFRDKATFDRVVSVWSELRKYCQFISDQVFCLNQFQGLGHEGKGLSLNFSWYPEPGLPKDQINLSVL